MQDLRVSYDEKQACYNLRPLTAKGKQWYINTFGLWSSHGKQLPDRARTGLYMDYAKANGLTVADPMNIAGSLYKRA